MMRVRVLLLTSVLAAGGWASGCGAAIEKVEAPAPPPSSSAQAPSEPAGCDAKKAEWAIGQQAGDALLEKARVAAGARTARFLRPNQVITMEYSSDRLNLELSEQDVVRSVRCG